MAELLQSHSALDRKRSAVHEAGHVVVAVVKGVTAWARIWETDTPSPFKRHMFAGQAKSFLAGDAVGVISIAGAVAESLDYCGGEGGAEYLLSVMQGEEEDANDSDYLSPADLAGLPADDWDAVTALAFEAEAILIEHAWFHKLVADRLIEYGFVGDSETKYMYLDGPKVVA